MYITGTNIYALVLVGILSWLVGGLFFEGWLPVEHDQAGILVGIFGSVIGFGLYLFLLAGGSSGYCVVCGRGTRFWQAWISLNQFAFNNTGEALHLDCVDKHSDQEIREWKGRFRKKYPHAFGYLGAFRAG